MYILLYILRHQLYITDEKMTTTTSIQEDKQTLRNRGSDSRVKAGIEKEGGDPDKNSKTFKVIMLGNSGVGKTSILQRLWSDEAQLTTSPTVGMDQFVHTVFLEDSRTVRLWLWDTSGSERYNTFTKGYMRNADAVIFVYNVSDDESYTAIERVWYPMVRNTGENPLMVVVGNQKDDTDNDISVSYPCDTDNPEIREVVNRLVPDSRFNMVDRKLTSLCSEDLKIDGITTASIPRTGKLMGPLRVTEKMGKLCAKHVREEQSLLLEVNNNSSTVGTSQETKLQNGDTTNASDKKPRNNVTIKEEELFFFHASAKYNTGIRRIFDSVARHLVMRIDSDYELMCRDKEYAESCRKTSGVTGYGEEIDPYDTQKKVVQSITGSRSDIVRHRDFDIQPLSDEGYIDRNSLLWTRKLIPNTYPNGSTKMRINITSSIIVDIKKPKNTINLVDDDRGRTNQKLQPNTNCSCIVY